MSNDCARCVTHEDAYNTSCFWCNDVMACMPTGNEQTCRQVLTSALVGDCRCLSGCENDVFVNYATDGVNTYAFTQPATTDVGPVIGLAAGCTILMGIFVLLVAKILVTQQARQEWKRYYALRNELQNTKSTKASAGLLKNQAYEGKGKGKGKGGDDDEAPKKKKRAKKTSGDEKPVKKSRKRQDSDSDSSSD